MTQVSRRSDASNARPERRVSHSNEETFIQITKSLTGGRFIGLWRHFLRQWRGEIIFWGIWIRKFASSTDFVSRLSFSSFVSFEQQTTNKCIEIFFSKQEGAALNVNVVVVDDKRRWASVVDRQSDKKQRHNMTRSRFIGDREVLTLYVRAGCDNVKYGACPFCQRIFMVLMMKAETNRKKSTFFYA